MFTKFHGERVRKFSSLALTPFWQILIGSTQPKYLLCAQRNKIHLRRMLLCLSLTLALLLLLLLSPQHGNVDGGIPFILGLDLASVNIASLAEAVK